MFEKILEKIRTTTWCDVKRYLCMRLEEASTWQGIGFIISACGGRWALELDWGAAAFFGGGISALIKMMFPDKRGRRNDYRD